jgi:hypothetical protein
VKFLPKYRIAFSVEHLFLQKLDLLQIVVQRKSLQQAISNITQRTTEDYNYVYELAELPYHKAEASGVGYLAGRIGPPAAELFCDWYLPHSFWFFYPIAEYYGMSYADREYCSGVECF